MLALVTLLCTILVTSAQPAANVTGHAVLLQQAKGTIPNAYGPVRARLSPSMALILQFTLAAGTGYKAGTVTVTTDATGRVVRIAKEKQACTVTYAASCAVRRVSCATSTRNLESTPADERDTQDLHRDVERDGITTVEDAGLVRRRLATCASCVNLVNSAFKTKMKAVCPASFSRLIPTQYLWARNAAVALCGITTKLGTPLDVAYRTCRCPCASNAECSSSVCLGGICAAQKLAAGKPCPDGDSGDCLNGQCALSSYPSGDYICCDSNGSVRSPGTNEYYCTETQGEGLTCDVNEVCTSGACSEGVCAAQKIGAGQPCPEGDSSDCLSGRCARSSFPSGDYVCCDSNWAVLSPGTSEYYCTGTQGEGLPCDVNEVCSSGACSEGVCAAQKFGAGQPCPEGDSSDCLNGLCARSSYPSGDYVCCDSNLAVYSWTTRESYCTGTQGAGLPCGDLNEVCSSGSCSEGVCAAQKLGAGQPCPEEDSSDCLNGLCARSSYPSGDHVCCDSNLAVYSWTTRESYCTGTQGAGLPCGDLNDVCSSGSCEDGVCRAQKRWNGEACPEEDDGDCLNGLCRRSSYPSGKYVCCDSNSAVYSWTTRASYCTGTQGAGLPCGDNLNDVCSSGSCEDGVCLAQKHWNGEACPEADNADCWNGACGRSSYPFGAYVCCNSNIMDYSWTTRMWYCVAPGTDVP